MRDIVTTIVEVAGATAVIVGVGLVSVPAALVVGGVLAIVGGALEGRK